MLPNYKEVRGVVVKKYRNIFGKYVLLLEEKGIKTKIYVNETMYHYVALDSTWTIGHINGNLINMSLGLSQNTDE